MTVRFVRGLLAASFAFSLLATVSDALAQDASRGPVNGTVELTDRDPDHVVRTFSAGGGVYYRDPNSSCRGYFGYAPDLEIKLNKQLARSTQINIYAYSAVDTVMVIRDAAGRWHCNDDGGTFRNPRIWTSFVDPQFATSDRIKIWVGTYDKDAARVYGWDRPVVSIFAHNSELGRPPPYAVDPLQSPLAGRAVLSAPVPDDIAQTHEINNIPNKDVLVDLALTLPGLGCRGHVPVGPGAELTWWNRYGTGHLHLFGRSFQVDTVMLVRDAKGKWHCDDDDSEGWNPAVTVAGGPEGNYLVWIGTYARQRFGTNRNFGWTYSSYLHASQLHTQF